MVRHFSLILCLMAGSILWCSTGSSGNRLGQPAFPQAHSKTYADPEQRIRTYMVQEPEVLGVAPNLLLYMHGSAGKEEQGMDPAWARGTFARLRVLMNSWGWVYACPRDAEFAGLLEHLREKYEPKAIYLAGASGGGSVALREAERNPSAYAGLLLLGPAIGGRSRYATDRLAMPMWIVSGARDREISRKCRVLVKELEALQSPYFYREIAGGRHTAPLEQVDWAKALDFLRQQRRSRLARLAEEAGTKQTMASPRER